MFSLRVRNRHAAWIAALLLVACGGGEQPDAPSSEATAATEPARASLRAGPKIPRAASPTAKRNYIVQLAEPPVAAYEGGIDGQTATKPTSGRKLDPSQSAALKYSDHLAARHSAVLAKVGGGNQLHSYRYVFNGFSAELTEAQAQALVRSDGVVAVVQDEIRKRTTSSTPEFLGLSGPGGFWKETGAKGEDVIIGVIDSGIWPEHPSFSDRNERGERVYDRPRGWNGTCQAGSGFAASDCNRKLIGARFFNAGLGGDAGIAETFPYEFNSPRDYDGHGTQAASIAGGNADVQLTGSASSFGKISGMAPRARIASYKACWGVYGEDVCTLSDLLAAIDQAVADGVDVINYSIGIADEVFSDPVAQAFLRAADAGIFVAASASNDGPTPGTVQNISPWITTVAAGTHNRKSEGSLTLGNGAGYVGVSAASIAVPFAPLINAGDAAMPGADPSKAALCFAASDNGSVAVLDPAKVTGKIVVCDRGTTFRLDKSLAVQQAGGLGMVLLNTSATSANSLDGDLPADPHAVPTVHLPVTDRSAVKTYAAMPGSSAAISKANITLSAPAPYTAFFSSRGPTPGFGDLLKPDLIAPGFGILAGAAPPGNGGSLFALVDGTSFSAPHVAGLAALLKEARPGWSPMAIKSALMTTAGDVLDGPNTDPDVIFSQGAGHVRASSAVDPGLVFDSGSKDWLGFLCGVGLPAANCTSARVPVLDASDLNVPSIAIDDFAGRQTVTRRVTNVDSAYATYTPSYSGMAGFDVTISPSSLTLAPGQTKPFRVTFTRTNVALKKFAGGQLTWTGGTSSKKADQHRVRIPMVVRPVALAAPREVSDSYGITFGYSGPFSASARGLIPATKIAARVAEGESIDIPFSVPAGTTYGRFSLFDVDVRRRTDLDLEVFDSAGQLVGVSATPTSDEEVSLTNPVAGMYVARVYGYTVPQGTIRVQLSAWALGSAANNNMAVKAPTSAVAAARGEIDLKFKGLTPGKRYLGSVVYRGHPGLPDPTIVRVDP